MLYKLTEPYMRDDQIKHYQYRLIYWGYPVDVDGVFGPLTDAAVKSFQKSRGLTVDGIIGPITAAALDESREQARPSDNALALCDFARKHILDVYVWGACGQTDITADWIRRVDDKGLVYAEKSIKDWQTKLANGVTNIAAFDCSGLVSKGLMELGLLSGKRGCDGLHSMCRDISAAELIPGDLLFRTRDGDDYHVAIYVGNGRVIEAKGRAYGVVCSPVGATAWNTFGRLRCLEV